MLQKKTDKPKKSLIRRLAGYAGIALALYSCASVGRIEGGPIDETPPLFLSANPANGSLDNTREKITITFDEFIKLEKPNEKLVISPPQVQQPEVKASGKKVVITLKDSLKPDNTYTFDFGDAIQDNNESNPLENFFYSFSTGQRLDTMAIGGTVLNASNLEPIKGILVGLHANLNDTAFTKLPFDRVGRTDSRGYFSIRGVAPGKYHIFALQDADQNYAFTQPTEQIAFEDSLIIPRWERRMRQDTTWLDSLTVDTIIEREYTHYLPDNVLLRAFKEKVFSQRFLKSERLTPEKFSLYFTAPADTFPTLTGLNFDATDAFVIENPTGRRDTLHYWIRDTLLHKQDSLMVKMDYLYTDSLQQLSPRTDTLLLLPKLSYAKREKQEAEQREKEAKEREKRKKKSGKEEEKEEVEKRKFLPIEVYAPGTMDIYDYLTLSFEEPVTSIDTTAFHLKQKVDSLWTDIPYEFRPDPIDIRKFDIFAEWLPEQTYSFEIDSAAIVGLYGLHTEPVKKEVKVKKLEEYGQLFFNIHNVEDSAFVELLDVSDKVLRTVPVTDGKADFYFLNPGKYGARLIVDRNANGEWDTGNYAENLQPEMVYYYPMVLELKANFDLTQEWNVGEKPLDRQKPEEMKKQKPDAEKKKKNRNNNSNRGGGNSGRGYGY